MSTRIKIITPEFRVSFAHVWEPKESQSGKLRYEITMLFPKEKSDMAQIQESIKAALLEKWPDASKRPPKIINPLKDGDTDLFVEGMNAGQLRKEKYPMNAGCWVATAWTSGEPGKPRPGICELVAGASKPQQILKPEDFYSGCWARAQINAFAYAPDQKNPQIKYGIGLGLENVMKTRDDEPFAGRDTVENAFGGISGPPVVPTANPAKDPMF